MKHLILIASFITFIHSPCYAVTAKDVFKDKDDYSVLNGVKVRKGTIASTYKNSLELDKLLTTESSDVAKINNLIEDQRPLSQGLYATEFFNILPLDTCLNDHSRQGRIMVAVLILQQKPDLMTAEIKSTLNEIAKKAHPILLREIKQLLD